jgi:hypothetical protein
VSNRRRCLCHQFDAQIARSRRTIFDNDGLSEGAIETLGKQTGKNV